MNTVFCVKYGQELEALPKPPLKGELGELVYQKLSVKGWRLWQICQTIVINDNKLNLMDVEVVAYLMELLEEFLENNDIEKKLLVKLIKQDVELPDEVVIYAKEQGLLDKSDDKKPESDDMFYEA